MNQIEQAEKYIVTPEEVARRIAEYRRLGWEYRSPAHMLYRPPHQECPWPECGLRIAGIGFNLKAMVDPERLEKLLASWWQGPGVVGRCPKCERHVLFGYEVKRAVPDPSAYPDGLLPDDWYLTAHLTPQLVVNKLTS